MNNNRLPADTNQRVLVIDDNRAIHDDFRKILVPATATRAALDATAAAVFGRATDVVPQIQFEVDSAYQGQEGVLLAAKALEAGRPYAVAFVDVRMPPGWDGVETTGKLWELDPNLQVVLCTAYSDYSWGEMFEQLGQRDGLLILKKPFDAVEAFQLAHALTEKWWLHRESRRKMEELESRVAERTAELAKTNEALQAENTERRRVEDHLRQLSRAVEQNPASIVITNPAGDIEYVNPKFVEVTGYTSAEALGKNPRILKSGDKGPEAYRELWQTITAGKEWRGEFHNKKKNGELYWESASISPIRNTAGVITHFVAVKEDITARKQTEAERDRLVQDLQNALAHVKSLSGLLPICASCKKIRDDKGYWSQVESYVAKHSEATFTHGICPDCARRLYPDLYDSVPEPTTPGTPAEKTPPRVTSDQ